MSPGRVRTTNYGDEEPFRGREAAVGLDVRVKKCDNGGETTNERDRRIAGVGEIIETEPAGFSPYTPRSAFTRERKNNEP